MHCCRHYLFILLTKFAKIDIAKHRLFCFGCYFEIEKPVEESNHDMYQCIDSSKKLD